MLEEERPLRALREAVAVIEALLGGDERGVDGERFRLEPGTTLAYPRVRERVPLLIGTWGRRTAAWAGTVADEVKLGGTANPELVPLVREWIDNPATRLVTGCVTVVDEDSARARARAHAAVGPYVDVVGGLDPTLAGVRGELPLDRFCLAGHAGGGSGARPRALGRGRRPRRARDAAGPHDPRRRRADLRPRRCRSSAERPIARSRSARDEPRDERDREQDRDGQHRPEHLVALRRLEVRAEDVDRGAGRERADEKPEPLRRRREPGDRALARPRASA